MRAGATFAEVLDAALGADSVTPAIHPPDVRTPLPVSPLLFKSSEIPASRPPLASRKPLRTVVSIDEARSKLPRPPARLPAPQQHAFLDLLQYGAELPEDFTAADLRHAFRALARRHHPDRHPDATTSEQAQLSSTFVTIAASYRSLLAHAR